MLAVVVVVELGSDVTVPVLATCFCKAADSAGSVKPATGAVFVAPPFSLDIVSLLPLGFVDESSTYSPPSAPYMI